MEMAGLRNPLFAGPPGPRPPAGGLLFQVVDQGFLGGCLNMPLLLKPLQLRQRQSPSSLGRSPNRKRGRGGVPGLLGTRAMQR